MRYDLEASLFKWDQIGAYDSAAGCHEVWEENLKNYSLLSAEASPDEILRKYRVTKEQDDTLRVSEMKATRRARCIATNDPRLKER
jgi:hypothetical protein